MKVLLHADVEKLGYFGDVVEVNDGFARNYLIPQGLAVTPTQANVEKIAEERARQAELRRHAHEEKVRAAEKVNQAEITIETLANQQGHLFGSVTEENIAAALRDQGFEIQARNVAIEAHLRELGTFTIKLHFAADVDAEIILNVVRKTDHADDNQPAPTETTEELAE